MNPIVMFLDLVMQQGKTWKGWSFKSQWNMWRMIISIRLLSSDTQEEILSFASAHIVIIFQFDYILTTFGHFKIANGLLHWLIINIVYSTFIILFTYNIIWTYFML
jgi:hypothetical protein